MRISTWLKRSGLPLINTRSRVRAWHNHYKVSCSLSLSASLSLSFLSLSHSLSLSLPPNLLENFIIGVAGTREEGNREEFEGVCKMRKRQVVVRREQSPRSQDNSSLTVRSVRYRECQKNHAANVGGYAVDGCREFMASGEEGTSAALTCAACGCHRNFHKREVNTEAVCECSSPPSNTN